MFTRVNITLPGKIDEPPVNLDISHHPERMMFNALIQSLHSRSQMSGPRNSGIKVSDVKPYVLMLMKKLNFQCSQ